MELTLRNKIVIGSILLLSAYALGRYATPEKIKIQKEIQIVTVKESETKVDKNQVVKTKTTTAPDGTKVEETETTTKEVTDTTAKESDTSKTKELKIVDNGSKLNLSILAGVRPGDLSGGFVYGAHVTRQVIGPFTMGVFVTVPHPIIGLSIGMKL